MPSTSTDAMSAAAALNAVVRITETVDGAGWEGTGVLISPDEVLTANHLAYRSGNGGHIATDIQVVPGYQSGAAPLGTYTGTVAHYSAVTNEPIITYTDMQDDYAIIHLTTPVANATTLRLESDYAGGTVHITGYPLSANGSLIDSVQTVATDPSLTLYDSLPLGDGSSGSPVWHIGADGYASVVGVVSAVSADKNTAYSAKLTASDVAQINAWVAQDDPAPVVVPSEPPATVPVVVLPPTEPTQPTAPTTPPSEPQQPVTPAPATVNIADCKTGQAIADILSKAYHGPVAGVLEQYVNITPQSLAISANKGSLFIHTGSGDDAIAAHGGINVLDGGTGSNFLSGGAGADTFFVDARKAAADVWSTLTKLHSGDVATIWGISAASWADNGGAAGYQGLTMHAKGDNGANASLTLAGISQADMANGKVASIFGHDSVSGSDYLYVKVS